MIRFFILLIGVYYISCCSSEKQSSAEQLLIEFDGSKGEFYNKYDLCLSITESEKINEIISDFNGSEKLTLCPSLRPVLWEIDVSIIYDDQSEEHLFRIGSTTHDKITLSKAYRCYSNDALVQEIIELVEVAKIRDYDGPLNQKGYDQIRNDH